MSVTGVVREITWQRNAIKLGFNKLERRHTCPVDSLS